MWKNKVGFSLAVWRKVQVLTIAWCGWQRASHASLCPGTFDDENHSGQSFCVGIQQACEFNCHCSVLNIYKVVHFVVVSHSFALRSQHPNVIIFDSSLLRAYFNNPVCEGIVFDKYLSILVVREATWRPRSVHRTSLDPIWLNLIERWSHLRILLCKLACKTL